MIAAGIATYFQLPGVDQPAEPRGRGEPADRADETSWRCTSSCSASSSAAPFLPLAIIIYWFSNNIWTFGQQHYVFGKIAKEDEEKKEEQLRDGRLTPRLRAPAHEAAKGGAVVAAATEVAGEITESAGSEESATERFRRPMADLVTMSERGEYRRRQAASGCQPTTGCAAAAQKETLTRTVAMRRGRCGDDAGQAAST